MNRITYTAAELNRIGYMQVLAERNAAESQLYEMSLELERYKELDESQLKAVVQDLKKYLNRTGRY